MTETIKLGPIALDARDYASQGNAILGIRDSGKSYTATMLAERLMDAGIPIIAFDPIGLWRYLRVGAKGKGYPVVVAGGEGGDLPLTPQAAPEIVRAAMREGVSLVIDLYSMHLSKQDWKRIVGSCIRVLLYENKGFGLRHIFIEEAAEFVPQIMPNDGATGQVYAEIEKLARMGGNALLGYTLINQRAEQINKAVLELCDGMFLHRQKGKNSLNSLGKWLDLGTGVGGKEIVASLPTLPQGRAWLWAAGSDTPVLVDMPTKKTFHPDRRATRDNTTTPAKAAVNVSAFVEKMNTTLDAIVEKAKADDPKLLKAEIARLKRASDNPTPKQLLAGEYKRGHGEGWLLGKVEGYSAGVAAGWEKASALLKENLSKVVLTPTIPSELLVHMEVAAKGAHKAVAPVASVVRPTIRQAPPPRAARERASSSATSEASANLTNPQRDLLCALAWWNAMGHDAPTRTQLAAIAGWKPKGSNLRNRLSELSAAALIEYPATGLVALTEAGLSAAPEPDMAQPLEASIRAVLTNPQRQIFDVLLEVKMMDRTSLATNIGWEPGGSNLRNRLSELSALELVEFPSRGVVKLQDWVMS